MLPLEYRQCVAAEAYLLQLIQHSQPCSMACVIGQVEDAQSSGMAVDLQMWWGGTLPEVIARLGLVGFICEVPARDEAYRVTDDGIEYVALAIADSGDAFQAFAPFVPTRSAASPPLELALASR